MISTVLRVGWLNLKRDRSALLLTFVVPVVFFSIFAVIFGRSGRSSEPLKVVVVDEDRSPFSTALLTGLRNEKALEISADPDRTRDAAEVLVRDGTVSVAVVLPEGFGKSAANFGGTRLPVRILSDSSNPVATEIVSGLLQKIAMSAAPDLFLQDGVAVFEKFGGHLTDEQRKLVDGWLKQIREDRKGKPSGATPARPQLVSFEVVDVLGENKPNPLVAYYAAATAVMFLLYTCANAGGGTFLEEVESGTLDRLLATNLSMTKLLVGKWVYLTLLGMFQILIMFSWGALAFDLQLWEHFAGFLVMTALTSSAASALGLVFATLCKSRGQLVGISSTVILIMSALGGSMFPRYLMGEGLQMAGLATFNAWALDGYIKVFWRDAALWQLWPQALALVLMTVFFLGLARFLARKWESV